MDFYNVIFIEGVRRIGKSSQCVQLRQLISKDRPVHQMNLDQKLTPSQLMIEVNNIRDWCKQNPKGTLIVNGSIAFSIVQKDMENQKYGSSYEEYELPIKNFLNLLREFKIINVLIKANDYEHLRSRYSSEEQYNAVEVKLLYDGFEFFANSQISNFKWKKVEISRYDSILQIHAKIIKSLE